MIVEAFHRTLLTHGLIAPGDRVLVAVSGGGDSVALLRLLADHSRRVPQSLIVAHVNHRVRGKSGDDDQRFVESLAAGLGLRCLSLLAERGPQAGLPSEEALRKVRHALLARAARSEGCARIALAHTQDDQAETVLLRLLRGAGRRGLSAMAVSGPGLLMRPMLGITRAEARAYLERIGQACREDETNLSPRYLRNRIRREVLPALKRINPSVTRVLARTAELLAEEDRFLDRMAQEWICARGLPGPAGADAGRIAAPAAPLAELSPALGRRVARFLLLAAGGDPRGAAVSAVAEILDLAARGRDGDLRALAGGLSAGREGDNLFVQGGRGMPSPAAEPFRIDLEIPGSVGLSSDAVLTARIVPRESVQLPAGGPGAPDSRRLAWVDADVLGGRAVVRSRISGDRFHPLGGPGTRRLKQYLIDRKVPRRLRDRIPLVVGPRGIAWVVGHGVGHPYRLTERTRRVVAMEYSEGRSPVDVGTP